MIVVIQEVVHVQGHDVQDHHIASGVVVEIVTREVDQDRGEIDEDPHQDDEILDRNIVDQDQDLDQITDTIDGLIRHHQHHHRLVENPLVLPRQQHLHRRHQLHQMDQSHAVVVR